MGDETIKILEMKEKFNSIYSIKKMKVLTDEQEILNGFQLKFLKLKILYISADSNWQDENGNDFRLKIEDGVLYFYKKSISINKK